MRLRKYRFKSTRSTRSNTKYCQWLTKASDEAQQQIETAQQNLEQAKQDIDQAVKDARKKLMK